MSKFKEMSIPEALEAWHKFRTLRNTHSTGNEDWHITMVEREWLLDRIYRAYKQGSLVFHTLPWGED